MQIEIGKYYKTRDGQKVGPMRRTVHPHANMRFTDDEVNHWTENGTEYNTMPSGRDLISEWIETPPETGSMQELNVRAGDVVRCTDPDLNYYDCKPFTISKVDDTGYHQSGNGSWHGSCPVWEVISRASHPSPVITKTVTTHRIVPGVYGVFWVIPTHGSDNQVTIGMRNSKDDTMHHLNADELTAAITTLTAIRDALTHNSAK